MQLFYVFKEKIRSIDNCIVSKVSNKELNYIHSRYP
jgi:hypothetical protein